MNIGFIGLGSLGSRIAKRLLDARYDLTVCDIKKEAAQQLIDGGARWADSPKAMAESCELVLSSLPGPPQVEEVVYATNGLMAGWKQGDTYVDMTSSSPALIRRVARDALTKGVSVLDSPLSWQSGGGEGALTMMIGGPTEALDKVRPILETVGKKIYHVGQVGNGSVCKLVNNAIHLAIYAANAEGMVLGVKAGIDPQQLWEVIMSSTGANPILERYPKDVLDGKFPHSGFALRLAAKDLDLASQLADENNLPCPVIAGAARDYLEAKDAGHGDKAHSSVILMLEERAGVQVRSSR